MTEELVDALISLTERKLELLDKIYEFTKNQGIEINEVNMEDLNRSLDQKGEVMEKINELDMDFLNTFNEIKEKEEVDHISELDSSKFPSLKELKDLIGKASLALKDIDQLDKKNSQAINSKLEATKMELRKIQNGKKASKMYSEDMTGSLFLDEKK